MSVRFERSARIAATLAMAVPAAAQQRPPPPHPPMVSYDPIPGPYAVFVDGAGAIFDPGVLDRAVAGWAGPTLSAFHLCVQPGDTVIDRRAAWQALRTVALGLHSRGAAVAVIEPDHWCRSARIDGGRGYAYVEVRGMVRVTP